MKKIALFTGSKATANALSKQLKSFLPPEIQLDTYVCDEGIFSTDPADLYLFSSQTLYDEVVSLEVIPTAIRPLVGTRTINYDRLESVVSIPDGTKVLLVNDTLNAAEETKSAMIEIGLSHIEMTTFYPGKEATVGGFEVAITPGEVQYVPPHMSHVIDIGPRIFDFKTIARVLSKLDVLEASSASFSKMYLEKIIKVAKNLADSRAQVVRLNTQLSRVIDGFDTGLLIFDRHHNIVVLSDVLKDILKVKKFQFVGNRLNRVIFHKKLLFFLMDESVDENQCFHLSIEGCDYVVTKFMMKAGDLICASFKSEKEHHSNRLDRERLYQKGYVAKYDIDDIIGVSEATYKQKNIIKKLAPTDMNILIHGESGTGKELAASAIHLLSSRAKAPFLAVNFSALPDDLIESELFGYEEGAFTGAKKGGKKGLFEEADGGTLFLDEIGDISLKVQARLLRVLEEKEVMPIGGGEIRPVDVRIVAATNKNLIEKVKAGAFREDLFFRLKMGYIQLQPLRQRREDIEPLLIHMAQQLCAVPVSFDERLMNKLKGYDWLGNVRELKNTLVYMLAVRQEDVLSVGDLPDDAFEAKTVEDAPVNESVVKFATPEQMYFLKLIYDIQLKDGLISRQSLSKVSESGPFKRTENQVRRLLKQLEASGFIELSKGRKGIALTEMGFEKVERG